MLLSNAIKQKTLLLNTQFITLQRAWRERVLAIKPCLSTLALCEDEIAFVCSIIIIIMVFAATNPQSSDFGVGALSALLPAGWLAAYPLLVGRSQDISHNHLIHQSISVRFLCVLPRKFPLGFGPSSENCSVQNNKTRAPAPMPSPSPSAH